MAVTHLSDQEIQTYLDSKHHLDSATTGHLEECHACRTRLQQYEVLYRELSRPLEMRLSKQFDELILQKVGLSPLSHFGFKLWQILLLAAACLSGLGFSIIAIGAKGWSQLETVVSAAIAVTGHGLESVKFVGKNSELLLLTVIVISAISVLDRLYITRMRR